MNLDNLSREVRIVCRTCGNDEFQYDASAGDLLKLVAGKQGLRYTVNRLR